MKIIHGVKTGLTISETKVVTVSYGQHLCYLCVTGSRACIHGNEWDCKYFHNSEKSGRTIQAFGTVSFPRQDIYFLMGSYFMWNRQTVLFYRFVLDKCPWEIFTWSWIWISELGLVVIQLSTQGYLQKQYFWCVIPPHVLGKLNYST